MDDEAPTMDEKAVAVLENLRQEVCEAQTEMLKWKTMYKKERKANSTRNTPREHQHSEDPELPAVPGESSPAPLSSGAKMWAMWAKEKKEVLNELEGLKAEAACDAQRQQMLIQEIQLCSARVSELESGQTALKVRAAHKPDLVEF